MRKSNIITNWVAG